MPYDQYVIGLEKTIKLAAKWLALGFEDEAEQKWQFQLWADSADASFTLRWSKYVIDAVYNE